MKKLLVIICIFISSFGLAHAQAPSIGSLVKAFQQITPSNPRPLVDMLDAAGYVYRFSTIEPDYGYGATAIYVYSKNCKVMHEEYSNGLEYSPDIESPNASIIVLRAQGDNVKYMDVQIYSNSGFKTWVAQLKSLGYGSTSEGGTGNRGRDWQYVATGKPSIGIWNDFSNTYVLTIRK